MKAVNISIVIYLALILLFHAPAAVAAADTKILPKKSENGSLPRSFIGYGLLKETPENSVEEKSIHVLKVKQGSTVLKIIESYENRIFRIIHRVQIDASISINDIFSEATDKFGTASFEKKDRLEFTDGTTALIIRHRKKNDSATVSVELHDVAMLKEVAVKIVK